MLVTKYRRFNIYYDPPPIPIRIMDYHYAHDDYDVDDDRYGNGPSIASCKLEIDQYYADHPEEQYHESDMRDYMIMLERLKTGAKTPLAKTIASIFTKSQVEK